MQCQSFRLPHRRWHAATLISHLILVILFFMTGRVEQDLGEKCLLDLTKIVVQIPEHAENACESCQTERVVDEGRTDLDIQLFNRQSPRLGRHGEEEKDKERQTADHTDGMRLEVFVY